jgi:hypothetical protein
MEHSEPWFGGYTVDTETDGIGVSVGIDLDSVPLPAVRIHAESRRDERVGVVVRHDVPADAGTDAVGFHPEFGADDWAVYEGHRLAWTVVLKPGETARTLYGIWLTDTRQVFEFLDAPTVARIDPVSETERYDPLKPATGSKRLIDDSLADRGPGAIEDMVEEVRTLLSSDDESAAAPTVVAPPDDPDDGDDAPDHDPVPAGAVRAGRASLPRPNPREVAALDDGSGARGRTLFVRALVVDRIIEAPALLQDLVTAMRVRGRRVVTDEDGVRVDAVVDTDHGPRGLVDALAARETVVDAVVQSVDPSLGGLPSAETTEFDLLQRTVDRLGPAEIDAELGVDGGRPEPSVADLVAGTTGANEAPSTAAATSSPDPGDEPLAVDAAPTEETVSTLVRELDRLRDRVGELESEVSELRVRNRRLEELYQRERSDRRRNQRGSTTE